MNGEDDFLDDTLDMMASGYDNIVPMPGDGSYQCSGCGRVGNNQDDVEWVNEDKGIFKCPECGKVIRR